MMTTETSEIIMMLMMKWSTFLGLVVNVDNDKIDKGWRYKDIDANKVDKWCLQKIRMMIMMNMMGMKKSDLSVPAISCEIESF